MEKDDISNLKLVCKRWNKSICMFTHWCPLHCSLSQTLRLHGPTVAYGFPVLSPQLNHFRLETAECFTVVQREIEKHFSTGSLQGLQLLPLADLDDGTMEQYWKEAKIFLQNYGKHIYLIVIGLVYCNDILKLLSMLKSILAFLPNLHKIEFVSSIYDHNKIQNATASAESIQKIMSSFPKLPKLECLKFEDEFKLYEFMKAMILNSQQFVKKLEMGMWAFPKLPDLLDLSINITDLILFDVYSLVYLGKFLTEQAKNGNNLRNLYINFTYKITTMDLFALIEGTKIEKLVAEFVSIEEGETCEIVSGPSLYLPTLISVALDDTNDLTCYECLNWVPNLMYLTLRGKAAFVGEDLFQGSQLSYTLKQCLYTMKAPNLWLWQRMPKLQMLTLSNDMDRFFEKCVYYFRPSEF